MSVPPLLGSVNISYPHYVFKHHPDDLAPSCTDEQYCCFAFIKIQLIQLGIIYKLEILAYRHSEYTLCCNTTTEKEICHRNHFPYVKNISRIMRRGWHYGGSKLIDGCWRSPQDCSRGSSENLNILRTIQDLNNDCRNTERETVSFIQRWTCSY